jgi:hypothetical protein
MKVHVIPDPPSLAPASLHVSAASVDPASTAASETASPASVPSSTFAASNASSETMSDASAPGPLASGDDGAPTQPVLKCVTGADNELPVAVAGNTS